MVWMNILLALDSSYPFGKLVLYFVYDYTTCFFLTEIFIILYKLLILENTGSLKFSENNHYIIEISIFFTNIKISYKCENK
jgi:hypothetical protein